MISVLLVDDHPVVRRGLSDLLSGADDVVAVAAVEDGAEAVGAVLEHRPDVVRMDLSMPRMDGIQATCEVLAVAPQTRVVVLTSFAEADQVTAALASGAVGCPRTRGRCSGSSRRGCPTRPSPAASASARRR